MLMKYAPSAHTYSKRKQKKTKTLTKIKER